MTNSAAEGGREPGPSQVQSVDRAIAILYLLAKRGNAGVTEVAADLGVHKSTAFRLIAALEAGHLIEQDGERGKYHLGRGILRLAGATAGRLEVPTESRPVCRQLAAELGEAVNVAILDSGEATNILQEYGTASITGRNWIGQRTPLHATASGKVLLAWMDAVALKEFLASKLHRYTPETVTKPALLEAELARVREQGWASTTEEFEIGLNAVAAPILGRDRRRGGRRRDVRTQLPAHRGVVPVGGRTPARGGQGDQRTPRPLRTDARLGLRFGRPPRPKASIDPCPIHDPPQLSGYVALTRSS